MAETRVAAYNSAEAGARLASELAAREEDVRKVRRYLHRHPEASGTEIRTTAYISELLSEAGVQHRLAPSGRGLVADIGPIDARRRIALRADIDALRLQDEKTVLYRSVESNLMHACGHDAHTAMLVGVALGMAHCPEMLPPDSAVRFIFQPAEETAVGALEMIEAGALDGVTGLIGQHVDPSRPVGRFGLCHGVLTAICEEFEVRIEGEGGHGARPHETLDPLAAMALYVQTVYQQLPRRLNAQMPSVVSFGVAQAGINPNVIPDSAQLRGTIRCLTVEDAQHQRERMTQIAEGLTATTGCRIQFILTQSVPAVVNDDHLTQACQTAVERQFGAEQIDLITKPSMGAEDFAYYSESVPVTMYRLGVATRDETQYPLHSPRFDINERALLMGTQAMALSALEALASPPS